MKQPTKPAPKTLGRKQIAFVVCWLGHPPQKPKNKLKEKTPKKKKNKEETAQQLPSSHRGHKKYHLPPIYMSL